MSAKQQHNNILLAILGFLAVVVIVALIGFFTIDQKPDEIQGEVEVSEYRVSSKVPGRILELRVKEGDFVRVGDTLAILDAPEVRAKKTQAQSAEDAAAAMSQMAQRGARKQQVQAAYQLWQQAKAAAEVTKKSYDRVQRLFNEGVVTAQKRDEVSAQVNRARGAVAEVNSYMRETVQVAQMEGEVSDIYPKVGELVGTGAPIMSIAVMNDMWGTFNVREDQLAGMTVGSEFTAYSPAFKKDLKMKVYYIKDQGSFAVWKATKANGQYDLKTFEVKARPVEKFEGLRPGMSLIIKN